MSHHFRYFRLFICEKGQKRITNMPPATEAPPFFSENLQKYSHPPRHPPVNIVTAAPLADYSKNNKRTTSPTGGTWLSVNASAFIEFFNFIWPRNLETISCLTASKTQEVNTQQTAAAHWLRVNLLEQGGNNPIKINQTITQRIVKEKQQINQRLMIVRGS